MCVVLIFGSLSCVYILPTIYHDYRHLDEIDNLSRQKRLESNDQVEPQGPLVKDFAKDAIEDIKKKAQQERENAVSPVQIYMFYVTSYIYVL